MVTWLQKHRNTGNNAGIREGKVQVTGKSGKQAVIKNFHAQQHLGNNSLEVLLTSG